MKIKSKKYKIIQTAKDTFKVVRIVSYFGIEWTGEFVGEEYYDITSAQSFIKLCTDNTVEIKFW